MLISYRLQGLAIVMSDQFTSDRPSSSDFRTPGLESGDVDLPIDGADFRDDSVGHAMSRPANICPPSPLSIKITELRRYCTVSATDPDCGVNAMVNYTLGEGFGKLKEFEVRSATGEVCITSSLDYETRNVYEFPVVATDRGGLSTTAMVKIQVTDVNDNRPVFYPRVYNVSLREGGASSSATTPVVVVATTDPDSGRFGTVTYKIVAGNDAGLFRIDKNSGEIFVNRPNLLSSRSQPYHRLNISATDGGNLKSLADAEVFISVIDSAQRPPIFEHPRYTYSVKEDVRKETIVGNVKATVRDSGDRKNIRYSIYSGDPEGFFRIDPSTGAIRTASALDHELRSSVLLNIQATNGDPPVYGHTQVNIEIQDVNDNAPEFESNVVRISVPENVETGIALYAAHARDRDSGANGVVRYKIVNNGATGGLFNVDPKLGHLTLTRHLDYETTQRHSLIITATDTGIPPLSANLTVLVEVQDVNDNPPVFERNEYSKSVEESRPVNSQILQVTAVDLDTGNNARLTYRLLPGNNTGEVFGIFPNSGWLYLKGSLDRETKDRYELTVTATDNGTPSLSATAKVLVKVSDANDNDPKFMKESYEFSIEENLRSGSPVGKLSATDEDIGINAVIRYSLIPGNTSFQINPASGEITAKEPLDRERKETYDLVAEARDQGTPSRSSRVAVKIHVLDVNDNVPEIIDPQEDVVSVREEQPPGTEVVRVRAVDSDNGQNASITYSLLKRQDSDGYGVFKIDPLTGVIRTRMMLDHEEKTIYRLAVVASDAGKPPKQTVRVLRVEVLDLNDNRPTFTSSSLVFRVREDVKIGHVVGTVAASESSDQENMISGSTGGHITYTLTSLMPENVIDAFDIDRSTGSLVVAKELDRERESEYRLEVRALDTSAMNNPQSSAITVRIDIADANDNSPRWPEDLVTISLGENTAIGSSIHNFTATDVDSGSNGDVRYHLLHQYPTNDTFTIDTLTGTLILSNSLDYETVQEYTIIISATDQSLNISERRSSSITARVIITDSNDNPPKFVIPVPPTAFISESSSIGMKITHLVAVDSDSGDNGRVTYVISSGNEGSLFALGYDTGVLTLAKPLPDAQRTYVLNVTATDHGTPTLHADMELKLIVQGSEVNPPRFFNALYRADVPEDAPVGTFVTRITAKSGLGEDGGNITFYIPQEIADGAFQIDPTSAVITTSKYLDRETKSTYTLPIYVIDSTTPGKTLFDVATITIEVTDVNDNAPEFKINSCYRLYVPENNDIAVIHTVVAKDLDVGLNGEITYSINGGNVGNKFIIDNRTGALTAKPLDRESHSRYYLTITAQDRGKPSMMGSCNITVMVEDQNDNDPKFDLSKYSTTIPEDISIDTSIIKVHASDADMSVNARIIYSLANESQWLFRIDNKTGVITTAGLFDRELQSVYNFLVVATDSGKYNARSQRVPVTVRIEDINDNKPIFTQYPFREQVAAYKQPGQTILKITAKDADFGTNSEIVYSLVNDGSYPKFRINPNTGILTATQSLAAENGRVIHLNVIATDKGNPPQSSTGLVEIIVGDIPDGTPQLRFQNSTYIVNIAENTEQFKDIVRVSAVRTDGRRQRIHYSFGTGNEDNIFNIDTETGVIQVHDPKNLDYELHKEIRLVVEAKTEGGPVLHGYCEVVMQLTDINDNAPKFTQQQYSASVWEGNKKGAFVLQVVAFDDDEGHNSRIRYHFLDGNHDNAFKIEPEFSGILKTNIVLDREIRDNYKLTVIATDEGVPQMTGTARIVINVVDVNDNQPTFPPPATIKVSEATEVGTVLTTVAANDVDTNPTLTYDFAKDNAREDLEFFSIDRFNVNDNAPVFSQLVYQANLPEGHSTELSEILTVNTTDSDSGDNARVEYFLLNPIPSFAIGRTDGILRANLSNISTTQDVQLYVQATDLGKPPLKSVVSVRIKTNNRSGHVSSSNKKDYKIQIPESTPKGTIVLHLGKPPNVQKQASFYIVDGNEEGAFEVSSPTGALIVVKTLDREHRDSYSLKITIGDSAVIAVSIIIVDTNDNAPVFKQSDYETTISEGTPVGTSIKKFEATDGDSAGPNSDITYDITSGNDELLFRLDVISGVLFVNGTLDYDDGVTEYNLVVRACDRAAIPLCTLNTFSIELQDENDNEPKFPVSEYLEFVGENESIGTSVFTAHATDLDKGAFGSLNYSIVSASSVNYPGTDDSWRLFNIDSSTGMVTTNVIFDYEQQSRYVFIVRATDVGGKSSNVKVRVEIESKDEFHPQFTERTYKFVLATSVVLPVGYVVGHVIATDRDKGPDGRVVYQLTTQHSYFKINRTTGAVMIKKKFDNEGLESGREISLVVTASSGRQGSLTNMTVVEITLDPLADPGTNLAINRENNTTVAAANGGIADWALGLLIALILLLITFGAVFVFLHMRNKRNKKINKPNLNSESVSTSNNYVDPSAFDTIPIRGGGGVVTSGTNQFAPPKYDEIPPYGPGHAASSNSGAATTSELSGSEQSGSSGRGSAEDGEDGEDEEIRMINEGPLQRDSGIHRQNDDDDNLSDVSVRNTQEYLARLGIVNSSGVQQGTSRLCSDPRAGSSKESIHHHQGVPLDSLHIFDEEGNNENDMTLIYAKLNDVAGSDRASSTDEGGGVNTSTLEHVMAMGGYGEVPAVTHQPSMNGSLSSIVHSEEELAGSYNWDYLLDWGPQYQPLAHVFSEIARLKDDTASVKSGASGNSSVKSKSSAPAKSIPPPLITSVAPRSIAMPVLNSRGGSSHHAGGHSQMMMLPRSPINHDASGATFSTSTAMSPSFSPSLSPLATKSPSISPLVTPGLPTSHHVMGRQPPQTRTKTVVDAELRI
ncbi:Protein dachsous-like Protein [Tribolium castaneum]|uniref:Protein dachsous-like Protein n=1 Tax=Tribolium castaneum TaxID=7070 RepID=A0A139WJJ2_TRICA|nr:Protein dachsous-like Protein [Tribolium castaneum]